MSYPESFLSISFNKRCLRLRAASKKVEKFIKRRGAYWSKYGSYKHPVYIVLFLLQSSSVGILNDRKFFSLLSV